MKKLFLSLFIVAAFISGCKKDEAKPFETPVKASSENKTLLDSAVIFPSFGTNYELGSKLYFTKNGTITKLGCRAGNKGTFAVSLWDFETNNLLASTSITVTDSMHFTYKSITPVDVTMNKRYVVSMNLTSGGEAKNYWLLYKKNEAGTNIIFNVFPVTTGNTVIEDSRYAESSTPVFPGTVNSRWMFSAGADVQFEYTE
ncbi:MAG TPA: DUF4082 domain-containing protein [Chitinophagales bacterium]|nr:DUF4082 domain-containing protein [Chitinophagales bacterium]